MITQDQRNFINNLIAGYAHDALTARHNSPDPEEDEAFEAAKAKALEQALADSDELALIKREIGVNSHETPQTIVQRAAACSIDVVKVLYGGVPNEPLGLHVSRRLKSIENTEFTEGGGI